EQSSQRVGINQLQRPQQLAELTVAGIDLAGQRQEVRTRLTGRRHRLSVCHLDVVARACQFAEFPTIPLPHVGEMAVDLLAALGDAALPLLALLGLLRQALRRRGALLGLLLDLGLAPLQPRLVAGERQLQLAELSLPVDQLLAESSNGEAVRVLRRVKD